MTRQGSAGAGAARADALIDYLVGFREELARSGYGPLRSGAHLELFADLCGWLEREGVTLLSSEASGSRRSLGTGGAAASETWSRAPARGRWLAALPVSARSPDRDSLCPGSPAAGPGALPALPGDRAGAHGADRGALRGAGGLLAAWLERGGAVDWQRVRARDVTRFLLGSCPAPRGGHAPYIVPALRSFLRFCYLEGVIPLPAGWCRPVGGRAADEPAAEGIRPASLIACLASWTGRARGGGGITRSWLSCLVSGFARARSRRWRWRISTGEGASSWCAGRPGVRRRSRCRPMSARRSPVPPVREAGGGLQERVLALLRAVVRAVGPGGVRDRL